MSFTSTDVAEYYNSTQNHYEIWWDLKRAQSLHYGIHDQNTQNFSEALINTNRVMMDLAEIKDGERILDAGCGVGGAALFLASQKKVSVTGITLSEKQVEFAQELIGKSGLSEQVDVQLMDYTNTHFPDASFDVIWACESLSSASDKTAFMKEAKRLLKPGGRIIISEYFLTEKGKSDQSGLIQKWCNTWSMTLGSLDEFKSQLNSFDFSNLQIFDFSKEITKSAKRMYYSALLGAIPSELYNLTHPKVRRFAKTHYRSGYYQYKALKRGLWEYKMIVVKTESSI